MSWDVLRPPLRRPGAAGARRRSTATEQRRRPLPARRNARRLHGAQRDDHRLLRTTRDWDAIAERHRRRLAGAPTQMRRWFERLEACGYKRRPGRCPAIWRARLSPAALVSDKYVNRAGTASTAGCTPRWPTRRWRSATEQVADACSSAPARRSLARRSSGRPLHARRGPRQRRRPERLARRATHARGAVADPDRDAGRAAQRHARAHPRDVAGGYPTGSSCARGALATRVLFDDDDGDRRDRRRVPDQAARLPRRPAAPTAGRAPAPEQVRVARAR